MKKALLSPSSSFSVYKRPDEKAEDRLFSRIWGDRIGSDGSN